MVIVAIVRQKGAASSHAVVVIDDIVSLYSIIERLSHSSRLEAVVTPLTFADAAPMSRIIVKGRRVGLFSQFFSVLGGYHHYDRNSHSYSGLVLDMSGSLYSRDAWLRAFTMKHLLDTTDATSIHPDSTSDMISTFTDFNITYVGREMWYLYRVLANRLMSTYCTLSDTSLEQAATMQTRLCGAERYVSVHRRGTDHYLHGPILPPHDFFNAIDIARDVLNLRLIFLATDEQSSAQIFRDKYGNDVVLAPCFRSPGPHPIFDCHPSRDKMVEEAVTDAVLLSRGDVLIKTSSNVTHFSCTLNPALNVHSIDTHVCYR